MKISTKAKKEKMQNKVRSQADRTRITAQQKLDLKYDNVRAYHKRARSREGFKKTVALARS